MINALLGSVIISIATVSLLIAVSLSESAIKSSASRPLSRYEKDMLVEAGITEISTHNQLETELNTLPAKYEQ